MAYCTTDWYVSNRLGVATDTPCTDLHVAGANAILRVGPYYNDGDRDYFEIRPRGLDTLLVTSNESMTIRNCGGTISLMPTSNVGIGTTSPGYKLTISDTASAKLSLCGGTTQNGIIFEKAGSGCGYYIFNGDYANLCGFGIYNSSTAALPFFINNSSYVGINTATPGERLSVNGGQGQIQLRVDTSDGSTINVRPNSGRCGWISYTEDAVADRWGIGIKNGDAKLYFASGNVASGGGTTRMVLDGSGNVGIGATSPSISGGGLEVARAGQAGIRVSSTGTHCGKIEIGSDDGLCRSYVQTVVPGGRLDFFTGNANVLAMSMLCSGNVGINTSSPTYKLHVNGTFYAAGSSIKYKEGICNYDTNSCLFMCLKPVAYQYKDEFKHLGKELKADTQIGLIAEDVAEVMPELAVLVNEEDEKVVRNVDYEKLSIVLLAEVQKLRKEMDELKQSC